MSIQSRKDDHLRICADEDVDRGEVDAGFRRFRFDHDALPEIDFDGIDTSVEFLGRRLRAPLLIGAMTGGTDKAREINHRLARAAARVGVGLELGSMRVMLKNTETTSSFTVKESAPDLPLLIGNIGAIQLVYGVGLHDLEQLVSHVGLDAMNFHLNPLQEVVQPEGDTRWHGVLPALREVIGRLSVPAIIKEVGAGIGLVTAQKLRGLPLAALNVAGVGGTSWSYVEGLRGAERAKRLGSLYRSWGVPTAEALLECGRANLGIPLVASGGLRSGLDMAKALRLGATVCTLARPFLIAAMESEEAVVSALEALIDELKVAMFCTGAPNLTELRRRRMLRLSAAPTEVLE
ncbi:MAG: type 2 isopentenyl-diphosphate Delta-isomerase [Myxococcales bacterium]|nr:type 2 isopentenyl-diphosphate Delta-isomerase [Myxococcales bacterium]